MQRSNPCRRKLSRHAIPEGEWRHQVRLAPKRVQNQLDWSILDVEQEEWD
jgi:hypothetical protein